MVSDGFAVSDPKLYRERERGQPPCAETRRSEFAGSFGGIRRGLCLSLLDLDSLSAFPCRSGMRHGGEPIRSAWGWARPRPKLGSMRLLEFGTCSKISHVSPPNFAARRAHSALTRKDDEFTRFNSDVLCLN